MGRCDDCNYYQYDDDDECYYCEADMDEDDVARMALDHYRECQFYSSNNEYEIVKKQM